MQNHNGDGDGLHPADMKRIRHNHTAGIEEFTVRYNGILKTLTLFVNGVERNHIKLLNDAESKFERCLKYIKDQFIAWRQNKH
jgi:hypothetical protein